MARIRSIDNRNYYLGGIKLDRIDVEKDQGVDCKTVRIFAYSITREQSNKRSGMRLKTESETGERRYTGL